MIIKGRYFQTPVASKSFTTNSVVFRIDDATHLDEWLEIEITRDELIELLKKIDLTSIGTIMADYREEV